MRPYSPCSVCRLFVLSKLNKYLLTQRNTVSVVDFHPARQVYYENISLLMNYSVISCFILLHNYSQRIKL